jgi:hypothetical protein
MVQQLDTRRRDPSGPGPASLGPVGFPGLLLRCEAREIPSICPGSRHRCQRVSGSASHGSMGFPGLPVSCHALRVFIDLPRLAKQQWRARLLIAGDTVELSGLFLGMTRAAPHRSARLRHKVEFIQEPAGSCSRGIIIRCPCLHVEALPATMTPVIWIIRLPLTHHPLPHRSLSFAVGRHGEPVFVLFL